MAIVKCGSGHFYDNAKYDSCPVCKKNNSTDNDDTKTMALFSRASSSTDDEKTIGINYKKTGCDPVVGWLVCIEGAARGRDFRLHSGRNFIGRDFKNDISLPDDKTINRTEAGYIIYEPHKSMFLAANGEGSAVYVNGELINSPKTINEDDKITIGSHTFELVVYCKRGKKW